MPEERQFSSLPDTDIWDAHKSIIRRLYVEEKRTLKKVKEIMELEHGFPSFPLSTYGTKLRDQLKLPKKLKKKDWPVVYRHYQQRQADGKQTQMYLNDTFIPWGKAWKEIRRYRVPLDSTGAILTPLPRGVMLKTPPPVPVSVCTTISQLGSVPSESQSFQIAPNIVENGSGELMTFYHQFSLMCLEDTPWFTLKATLLGKTESSQSIHTTPTHPQFSHHGVEQIQLNNSDTLDNFALVPPVSTHSELRTHWNPLPTLARAAYIISNNLIVAVHGSCDELQELLDFLFTRIPQRLVSDLFHSPLLSIQATWDVMGRNIHIIERQDIFVSWMKLGLCRPAQIVRYGHQYLSKAVSMGCIDIVRSLLKLGIRADDELPAPLIDLSALDENRHTKNRSAIYEATASQDTKCLELLLEFCDVNRTILNINEIGLSSFTLVLFSMGNFFKRWRHINWKLRMHQPSLKIMLEHGANVDLPCPEFSDLRDTVRLFQDNKLPYARPSILEYCYYFNKQLYYLLVPFSSRPAQNMYRDEIYLAASTGHSALLDYFTLKSCVDPDFFASTLAEQFLLRDIYFDSTVVRALLELDVMINTPSPEKFFTELLCCILRMARNLGHIEDYVFIMKTLLSSGALLNSKTIAAAVANEGTESLELISALGANFHRDGADALFKAAYLNNFVAVSWLLHRQVDINAAIEKTHVLPTDFMSIAVAAAALPHQYYTSTGCNMLQYLFNHGAKLWVGLPDTSPFAALNFILQNSGPDPHIFDKVRLIFDRGVHLEELPCLGIHLLEASLTGLMKWSDASPRSKVFMFLWENGAPVRPGAVLARLIDCQAPHQLILDLINSGADITAYMMMQNHGNYDPIQTASRWWDRSLVSALLEHGANINSPPFKYSGRTPLQAAITMISTYEAHNRAQIDFIQFLLRNNADVNAPAGARNGFTALQLAANAGNLQLLSLLLSHGALVNMPNHCSHKCALDFAAAHGRLDAVHFLLKAGALSYCHGHSGYEGAIRLARKEGFFVLVDSLNEHVRKNEVLFREQPTLAAAHCAAMKDRDWTDDMFSEEEFIPDDVEEMSEIT
ncbi:hypothetical protein F4860DRAFT_341078 [Xylaria cubensis]|nr:hypothetical protein F4860DRAFT_341078 [Xylaria cubensis]